MSVSMLSPRTARHRGRAASDFHSGMARLSLTIDLRDAPAWPAMADAATTAGLARYTRESLLPIRPRKLRLVRGDADFAGRQNALVHADAGPAAGRVDDGPGRHQRLQIAQAHGFAIDLLRRRNHDQPRARMHAAPGHDCAPPPPGPPAGRWCRIPARPGGPALRPSAESGCTLIHRMRAGDLRLPQIFAGIDADARARSGASGVRARSSPAVRKPAGADSPAASRPPA